MSKHTKASRKRSFRTSAEAPFDFVAILDRSGFAKAIRDQCREQEGDAPQSIDDAGVSLRITCGACPVQIEGTVDIAHLYFRARGGEWRCAIATTEETAHTAGRFSPAEDALHYAEGDDPDDGWMPHAEAWRIVRESIAAWRAGR